MRAILVIPEQPAAPCPSVPCLCLFPLLDRPFLQHVVEALVGRGVTELQVVCGQSADAVERLLGDGARWGCAFAYHLLRDPERPASVLRAAASVEGSVLIARADCLPALPAEPVAPGQGALYGSACDWSGWAVVDARVLAEVPPVPLPELGRRLAARGVRWVEVERLVLRSFSDVPAAQRKLLLGQIPGVLTAAREVRPGVWLGANVQLAPTTTLEPPVFVGENAAVGAGVRVGPSAVVGPDCLLARDSAVRDSTLCPGTYVGPGVELDGVIADGSTLVNPHQQTVTTIDPRLLDQVVPALPYASGGWRLLALAAFLAALPVVVAAAFWLRLTRRGPLLWRRRFVRAPARVPESAWEVGTVYTLAPPRAGEEENGWVIPATFRGLVLEFLPALWGVAWGSLRLVGVPPRDRDLLKSHGAQCPRLLRRPPGLVTEVALCDAGPLTPEDCLLVAAYQAETSCPIANLRRVCRFLLKALSVWGTPTREVVPTAEALPERLAAVSATPGREPIPPDAGVPDRLTA